MQSNKLAMKPGGCGDPLVHECKPGHYTSQAGRLETSTCDVLFADAEHLVCVLGPLIVCAGTTHPLGN